MIPSIVFGEAFRVGSQILLSLLAAGSVEVWLSEYTEEHIVSNLSIRKRISKSEKMVKMHTSLLNLIIVIALLRKKVRSARFHLTIH